MFFKIQIITRKFVLNVSIPEYDHQFQYPFQTEPCKTTTKLHIGLKNWAKIAHDILHSNAALQFWCTLEALRCSIAFYWCYLWSVRITKHNQMIINDRLYWLTIVLIVTVIDCFFMKLFSWKGESHVNKCAEVHVDFQEAPSFPPKPFEDLIGWHQRTIPTTVSTKWIYVFSQTIIRAAYKS